MEEESDFEMDRQSGIPDDQMSADAISLEQLLNQQRSGSMESLDGVVDEVNEQIQIKRLETQLRMVDQKEDVSSLASYETLSFNPWQDKKSLQAQIKELQDQNTMLETKLKIIKEALEQKTKELLKKTEQYFYERSQLIADNQMYKEIWENQNKRFTQDLQNMQDLNNDLQARIQESQTKEYELKKKYGVFEKYFDIIKELPNNSNEVNDELVEFMINARYS